jgi:hypothetical protein
LLQRAISQFSVNSLVVVVSYSVAICHTFHEIVTLSPAFTFLTSSGVSNKRCAASSAQRAATARESFCPALLFTIPFIIMSNALPPPISSSSFRHNAAARATPPPAIAQRLAAAQLGSKTATSSSAANSSSFSSSSSSQTAPSPHPRTHFLSSNAHELASDPTGARPLLPRTKS